MVRVPWPMTHAPGDEPQEGGGKLYNVFFERRGDEQGLTWRRAPGANIYGYSAPVGNAVGGAVGLGVSPVFQSYGPAIADAMSGAFGEQRAYRGGAAQAHGSAYAAFVGYWSTADSSSGGDP